MRPAAAALPHGPSETQVQDRILAAETIGGLLLIAGYRTREVSLLLAPVLLGAAWAHWSNGWVFSAPNGGWEYPVFLLFASGVLALLGDGAYSIGHLRGGRASAVTADLGLHRS